MNFKRGFRRVVFVLSLLASLTVAVLCFSQVLSIRDYEKDEYNDSINTLENITMFWLVWDEDGWNRTKREVIRHLFNPTTYSYYSDYFDYSGSCFTFDDMDVWLRARDIFPGYNEDDLLSMPLTTLDEEAQNVKRQAVAEATREVARHEFWGTMDISGAIFIGMAAALGGAGLGFLVPWIISVAVYNFSKWLILGFHDDTCDQIEQAKPSH